ncbi:MAG TPA: helix-turn-helix domain-containing protein [Streptosporangiaceae bacterium]|nr:helix-turn-helix domain-containing protein [Streptosporangiaceae bacterium]
MKSRLEIAEGAASGDPDVGPRAVAAMLGWSWQEIAERLGVTKQTMHRKHGKRAGSR